MAKLLQLRRGTTVEHNSFTGEEGEVTVDTDKDILIVHDGAKVGGYEVASGADVEVLKQIQSDSQDPNGFDRNNTASLPLIEYCDIATDGKYISIDQDGVATEVTSNTWLDGSALVDKTYCIRPVVGGEFTYYFMSKKHFINVPKYFTIPSANRGNQFLVFNATEDLELAVSTHDAIVDKVIVSMCNINDTETILVADERHGKEMNSIDHERIHLTQGAIFEHGFNPYGFVAGTDSWTKIGSGVCWDEDIKMIITDKTNAPFYFKEGADSSWSKATKDNKFAIKNGTQAQYNLNTAGIWSLEDLVAGEFSIVHYLATNDAMDGICKMVGQNKYSDIASAQNAIGSEIQSSDGLTFPEFVILYSCIVNDVGEVQALADDSVYLDMRFSMIAGAGGNASSVTSHNDLNHRDIAGSHPISAITGLQDELDKKPNLNYDLTVTVGLTSADYTTINAAIEYLSENFSPTYKQNGFTAQILLKDGFVMQEQVLVSGIDLSWITIDCEHTNRIVLADRAYQTIEFSLSDYSFESYPLFGAKKGASLPIRSFIFDSQVVLGSGTAADNKMGLVVVGTGSTSHAILTDGFIGCSSIAMYALSGGTISGTTQIASSDSSNAMHARAGGAISGANQTVSSDSSNAMHVVLGGAISAYNQTASSDSSNAMFVLGGTISAYNQTASSDSSIAMYVEAGGTISGNNQSSSSHSSVAMYVLRGGTISGNNQSASSHSSIAMYALSGGTISGTTQIASSDSSIAMYALGGGIISGYNQTLSNSSSSSTNLAKIVGGGMIKNVTGFWTNNGTGNNCNVAAGTISYNGYISRIG